MALGSVLRLIWKVKSASLIACVRSTPALPSIMGRLYTGMLRTVWPSMCAEPMSTAVHATTFRRIPEATSARDEELSNSNTR